MTRRQQIHYTRQQVAQWLKHRWPEIDWAEVESNLPPIIWRSRWDILADRLGLPYTRKYLQNLDSEGSGPSNTSSN